MKQKSILSGLEGKPSITGVFQLMDEDSSLIVKSKTKKGESMRLYEDKTLEKFKKVEALNFKDTIFVRWGSRIQVNENDAIVYNSNQGILKASNKFEARKLFEKQGISIPKLVTVENFVLEDLPIVARPFQHRQGKDFKVIKDFGSFKEFYNKSFRSWYFSAYIDKDAEYRVHCAHGRILSIMKKPRPEDPNVMAWNHAVVEDPFDATKWSEWDINLCKEALRACKALELDFCALDVIVKDGKSYILEANTCPSLCTSPYNTEKYAKYFNWLFMKDERREHWEFEDKKKAKSLAWKNWMFEDREPNEKE